MAEPSPKYLRPGFDFALSHAIEEAGEFLAAAGKTQRWGRDSFNPELPPEQRETNRDWLLREMDDLRSALIRLQPLLTEPDHKAEARDRILRDLTDQNGGRLR